MSLFDLATYAIWLSACVGLLCYKKLKSTALHFFVVYQVVSSFIDVLLIYFLPMDDGLHVRFFYSILKPIEYTTYVMVFNNFSDITSHRKNYLMLSIFIFYGFGIYNLLFQLKSISVLDNLILFEGILTLVVVLLYFRDTLLRKIEEGDSITYLWKQYHFWIGTGLLFFFAGNVISSGFYQKLYQHSPKFTQNLYSLMNLVLGIIQSILFAIAYIMASKRGIKQMT